MTAVRSSRALRRWLVGITAMVLAFVLAPAGIAHADPVTAADKDFVIRVRLAGLWEIPASQMAQTKSDDPAIVAIGKAIAAQHVILDKMERDVAKQLNIALPAQPNGDQQGWLAEMRAANSST